MEEPSVPGSTTSSISSSNDIGDEAEDSESETPPRLSLLQVHLHESTEA